MSKANKQEQDDDLRPEYDFSKMAGAVRGKYYERFHAGVNLRLLEPEVAQAFPTDTAVNKALRAVLRASRPSKRRTSRPDKPMPLKRSAKARRRGSRTGR